MNILGLDIGFVRGLLSHLANACTHGGRPDESKLNHVFATIKLMRP
jgi:hypothetical protein